MESSGLEVASTTAHVVNTPGRAMLARLTGEADGT